MIYECEAVNAGCATVAVVQGRDSFAPSTLNEALYMATLVRSLLRKFS